MKFTHPTREYMNSLNTLEIAVLLPFSFKLEFQNIQTLSSIQILTKAIFTYYMIPELMAANL